MQWLVEVGALRLDGADRLSWHAIPENKKTQLAINANWVVPVLAVFIQRPQSELKSAPLRCLQRVSDNTEQAVKSQLCEA
jgi:hypothetical protein